MQNIPPVLRTSLLVALLSTATLHAQIQVTLETPGTAYTTSRLNAVVLSSLDGRPVARVLITSPDRHMAVLTDSEGRFTFELRRAASPSATRDFSADPNPDTAAATIPMQFLVRKPGYISDTVTLRLPAIQPDTPEPTFQLKIVPAGILTGHLYPESGELPADLSLQLRRKQIQDGAAQWIAGRSAQVNSHGEFRFADLQPGEYKLLAPAWTPPPVGRSPQAESLQGLLPAFYPGVSSSDTAAILHLSPGQTASANLTLRSATFYRIAVPMPDLNPSQGVGIALLPDSADFILRFNTQSRQIEGYLPTGSYTLRLTSYGPSPATSIAHLQVTGAPVHSAVVSPNASVDLPVNVHRDFTAERTTQFDRPQPSVYVNLQSIDSPGNATGLAPFKSGDSPDELHGPTDLLRDPLSVAAGGSAAPIEITLRDDFATLSGHILLDPTQPAQPANQEADQVFVLLLPLDRPQAQPINYGVQESQFISPNLAPGRYLILASHQQLQNLEYRNQAVLRDLLGKGTTITLSPNQKAEIEIPLIEVPLLPEDAK